MNQSNFAKTLKKKRLEKNLTLQKLAEMSGVSTDAISKYETGKRTPNMNAVISLAKSLEVTIEYLTGGKINENIKQNYINAILAKYGLDAPFLNVSSLPDQELMNLESDIVIMLKVLKEKYKL